MAEPNPEIRQLLVELRDFNKERRRRAVYKLGMVGGESAIRALMLTVDNSNEDLIVRGRAAQMLGVLRDPRAVDTLILALEAPGYQTPMNAAEALGRIGDKIAIQPLLNMAAYHPNENARKTAKNALVKLGYMDEKSEADNTQSVNATELSP
jgi:hypothetical protein